MSPLLAYRVPAWMRTDLSAPAMAALITISKGLLRSSECLQMPKCGTVGNGPVAGASVLYFVKIAPDVLATNDILRGHYQQQTALSSSTTPSTVLPATGARRSGR